MQNIACIHQSNISQEAQVRNVVRIPVSAGELMADLVSFEGLVDEKEHLALGLGAWEELDIPLVRLHSECLTGDVFGSAKCDCGPQLREAMQRLSNESGVLLYLRQEGRGIGLYNKLDAYSLQEEGLDTYAANRRLNFADDLRDYEAAAEMLKALGFRSIRLLTNNPDKVAQLEQYGIKVIEMVPTGLFQSVHNKKYLEAKAVLTNHTLNVSRFL